MSDSSPLGSLRSAPETLLRPAYRRSGSRALRRFAAHRMALVGAAFLVVVALIAISAPVSAPYGYDRQDLFATYRSPSRAHWAGTDALGRDVLSRLMYGARVSMSVGLASAALVLAAGVPLGLVAGYFGGTLDLLLMRVVDIVFAIPFLLLVVLLQTFFTAFLPTIRHGPLVWLHALNHDTRGVTAIVMALALVGWLDVARVVRGQVLTLRHREFVLAAQSLGAADRRVMGIHLLPNIAAPIIVMVTLLIPTFIIAEAGLSFLGLGVQPPVPSWGTMIAEGVDSIESYPRLVIAPGLALAATLLSLNFVGDGLRDALDPVVER
ncbi:MAG TPA: ABC transporter permease [bacterium]|nr:ABC transporter permease [bacterium]